MKWLVGLITATSLVGGCCQREIWVHLSSDKEVRKATSSPAIFPASMPTSQATAPIETVEAVVYPIIECEELIIEKTEEIEQDVEAIREILGDDAKKVEVELNRIKLNAGIIRVRCFIIEQLLGALKKVLTEFPTTSHVIVSENKIVTYTNVPASKPAIPIEKSRDNLIILLVVVVVVLCGIVIGLIVIMVKRIRKNKERIKKMAGIFDGKNIVSSSPAKNVKSSTGNGLINRKDSS